MTAGIWANKIDGYTLENSRMTLLHFFLPQLNIDDRSYFTKMVDKGCYYSVKYNEFFNSESPFSLVRLQNIEKYRMSNFLKKENKKRSVKETFELIYPKESRPRGDRDIDILFVLQKTKKKISPIVFLRTSSGLISLDGQHRFFFSMAMKYDIRCLVIDLSIICNIAFFSKIARRLFLATMQNNFPEIPHQTTLFSEKSPSTSHSCTKSDEVVCVTNLLSS